MYRIGSTTNKPKAVCFATLLTISLLGSLLSCGDNQSQSLINFIQTGRDLHGLKGPVQSYVLSRTPTSSGALDRNENARIKVQTASFNQRGNTIESTYYDLEGSPWSQRVIENSYNNGHLAKTYEYDSKGQLVNEWIHKYNETDMSITMSIYDTQEMLQYQEIVTLRDDGEGFSREVSVYNTDGSLLYHSVDTVNNKNGNVMESITHEGDGTSAGKITYSYNDRGSEAEVLFFDDRDGSVTFNYSYDQYVYDHEDNWTERVVEKKRYASTELVSSESSAEYRTITYYE